MHIFIYVNASRYLNINTACTGFWYEKTCNGHHFIGKYRVAKESIVFEETCKNGKQIELEEEAGFISSSNYSYSAYKPRERYQWLISAPQQHFIKLIFKDFETEKYYDVLSVYSGESSVTCITTQ